jgi:hypothetical protein
MEHGGRVLGPAQTRFNDYIGTVAADDAAAVTGQPSLYELANIDRDLYTIVAVDLRIDGLVTATVYAVDRIAQGIGPDGDLVKLGEGSGEISLVPFDLPEPNVGDFIRCAFPKDLGPLSGTAVPRPGPDRHRAEFTKGERRLAPSSPTDPRVRQL